MKITRFLNEYSRCTSSVWRQNWFWILTLMNWILISIQECEYWHEQNDHEERVVSKIKPWPSKKTKTVCCGNRQLIRDRHGMKEISFENSSENVEKWKECCSLLTTRKKLNNLQHHKFSWVQQRAKVSGQSSGLKSEEREAPPRRAGTQTLAPLKQTREEEMVRAIQTFKMRAVKIFNKLLTAKCGLQ